MGDLYDKSYKQIKKRGFKLPVTTNRVVVARLRNYPKYIETAFKIRNKSKIKLNDKDIARLCDLESLISAMDNALSFVPEEYKEAIKERLNDGTEWEALSEKYNYSERALKGQWQRYKYGAAIELGEDVIE